MTNKPIPDAELRQLRELCEGATPEETRELEFASGGPKKKRALRTTPEPWRWNGGKGVWSDGVRPPRKIVRTVRSADAQFIAAARSALPRLLDEIERLRETCKAVSWLRVRVTELEDQLKQTGPCRR